MKTVYKLLTRHNKQLHSYLKSYDSLAKYMPTQRYFVGDVVMPKIGKIFAFDTWEHARNYPNGDEFLHRHVVIAEARTTHVTPWENGILSPHGSDITDVKNFWNEFNLTKSFPSVMTAPIGTVLCDDLIIVRVLKTA